jgi:hypothetical protein
MQTSGTEICYALLLTPRWQAEMPVIGWMLLIFDQSEGGF